MNKKKTELCHIIALAQHKGGVGKTTSTVNIGAALSLKGYKVLLVDLDAQANLTESLGFSAVDNQGIVEALTTDEPIKPLHYGNMAVITSSLELAGVEVRMLNEVGRELILKEFLKPYRKEYDFILIDCPPSLGLLTVNALTAADEVYIPLQAEYLAIRGLNSLLDIVKLIRKQLNKKLEIGGVIITQYDSRKVLNRDTGKSIKDLFKSEVLNTKIRDNIALAEAPTAGKTIFDYAPTSYGAEDYKQLTDEILKRNKTK